MSAIPIYDSVLLLSWHLVEDRSLHIIDICITTPSGAQLHIIFPRHVY